MNLDLIDDILDQARGCQADAWERYLLATRNVRNLQMLRAHMEAHEENDLRNKISAARAEADRLMLVPAPGISEDYRQALKTYADLRAELIRINPGAM